jgi:hypothetical protein
MWLKLLANISIFYFNLLTDCYLNTLEIYCLLEVHDYKAKDKYIRRVFYYTFLYPLKFQDCLKSSTRIGGKGIF